MALPDDKVLGEFSIDEDTFLMEKPSPWPSSLNRPPWRIESGVHPESENINKILAASMNYQRAKSFLKDALSSELPLIIQHRLDACGANGKYFKDFLITNACLETTSLMHHYLKAYLTKTYCEDESKLEFAFGLFDGLTEHCWLELNGQVIETTFVYKENQNDQLALLQFYNEKFYFKENEKLMEDNSSDCPGLTSRDIEAVAKTIDGPEKYVSYLLGRSAIEPFVIYDMLMRQFLLQEINLVPPDLVKKWSERCWTCGKTEASLKTCSVCKWAKYCGRACQVKGRQLDKLLDVNSFGV